MKFDATLVAYVGLTVLALMALVEWADPAPSAGAECRVGYVYDGDSVEMFCGISKSTARIVGLDSPELEARCAAEKAAAEAAKRALAGMVRTAEKVEIEIEGHDKFGRDLIRLFLDGQDAADLMIGAGHARTYSGGQRGRWC